MENTVQGKKNEKNTRHWCETHVENNTLVGNKTVIGSARGGQ